MNRHFHTIVAIAITESRSLRRATKTYIFIVLALVFGFLAAAYAFVNHYGYSHVSPSAGAVSPRFLAHSFGFVVLYVLLFGMIFLAFDYRYRDEQARVTEVLDTRNFSNLHLLLGKLSAVVLTAWLTLLLFVTLLHAGGAIANELWIAGEPLEWMSAASLLFVYAPPTLVLWCSTVMFLAVTFRNRLVVAVASLLLLHGLVWGLLRTPLYLLPATSVLGNVGSFASNILPNFVVAEDILRAASVMTLGVGIVVVGARVHPRPDAAPIRHAVVGAGMVVMGLGGIGLLTIQAIASNAQREIWSAVHAQSLDHPRPDIQRISGSIGIEPGDRLVVDVVLQLTARPNEPFDTLLLSLNPGMTLDEVRLNDADAVYSHQHGVLTVQMPELLEPTTVAHLSVVARGIPDPRFAYLDSAIDVSATNLADGRLSMLGTEASLFDSRFVALMPGIDWLPTAGGNFGGQRSPDLYDVDLEVEVPQGWLVAGPGRRRPVGNSARASRFRFAPIQRVPGVALIASRFESRRMTVRGVELELLFHRHHRGNYALHAGPKTGSSETSLDVRFFAEHFFLGPAEDLGLTYPHDGLTFVEVPGVLRGYGGGWRMDSVLAQPGVVLLREYGFPTAAFEFGYWLDGRGERDLTTKWNLHLLPYFGADFIGGNPFREVPKSSLPCLAGIEGDGAIALEFLLREIATRLLARTEHNAAGYFSAHLVHAATPLGGWPGMALANRLLGNTTDVHEAAVLRELDRDAVWNLASTVPLAAIDPDRAPRDVLGVLLVKARATARAIIDLLGIQRTAHLLSEVCRGLGEASTVTDVRRLASRVDGRSQSIIDTYLYESSIPGYLVSQPEAFRIADDERGTPRYQARLHVRNDEPVPGFARLFYIGRTPSFHYGFGDLVQIDGLASAELGVVTDAPPEDVILQVYFARNRTDLRFRLPAPDPSIQVREEGFHGARPSAWEPPGQAGVLIDDLDPGFHLLEHHDFGTQTGDAGCPEPVDQQVALPTFPAGPRSEDVWQRQVVSSSWGKYRRTVARTGQGNARRKVAFTAKLPKAGTWRLDYHWPESLPGPPTRSGFGATYRTYPTSLKLGTHDLTLVAAGETAIRFDASQADSGWNHLGDYDVPSGPVCLVVSNRTSGEVIVADAIRWRFLRPARGPPGLVDSPANAAPTLVRANYQTDSQVGKDPRSAQ